MNFNDIIRRQKEHIIQCTQELIRIESVKAESMPQAPFGEGIHKALEYVLRLGKDLGFRDKNLDGYAGYLEFGEGEELVGVLAHLDVVPAGDGWSYPAFGGELHNDKIYGRGAVDDKGPAISAIFAAKAVMDKGEPIRKRLRIIFGTDEENQWEGIKYYLKHEETPYCCIVPDGKYPLINNEKGILDLKISKKFSDDLTEHGTIKLISIKGGNRPNMVPDYCECELQFNRDNEQNCVDMLNKFVESTGYRMKILKRSNSNINIASYGNSAHGSRPNEGQNAIGQMMLFLNLLDIDNRDAKDFVFILSEKIGMEVDGEGLGISISDEESGPLSLNLGIIEFDGKQGSFVIDIRYPVTYLNTDIIDMIKDCLKETEVDIKVTSFIAPLHVGEESELVETLLRVYSEYSGETAQPLTSGGGTYARALQNAVAFGTLFPGQPDLAHQKDEHIHIDYLMKNTEIYAQAIYELIK